MEKKEWLSNDEICKLFAKANELGVLRDMYVKMTFGLKNAIKVSERIGVLRQESWEKIYSLYPELRGKKLTHYNDRKIITIIKE